MLFPRRDLLKLTALAAAPRSAFGASKAAPDAKVDVDVELRATVGRAVLDPALGHPAEVWRYEGKLLAGPASALTPSGAGYLGPTFRVKRGQRVRVRFTNGLAEPSIVHWHGSHVAQENDGHPRLVVGPGGAYSYDFVVDDRPGTYWYHPHPHDRTGPQVYRGLAGLFLVVDPDDVARGLPALDQELSIVLQERALDSTGELVYDPDPLLGFLGDRTFVNGVAASPIAVRAGTYRLRLLNASNARIYKLAWSDGSPVTVIGTDGGLLAAPVTRPYVVLAPAQRLELWADFGRYASGSSVWLESMAYSVGGGMMMGSGMMMGRGMMGRGMRRGTEQGRANGAAFNVCGFVVGGKARRLPLPKALMPVSFRPESEVVNLSAPRRIELSMMHMRWLLNGRSFRMTEVAPDEHVRLDTTEDWEFENVGHRMSLPHPMHLHGGQFQVVARSAAPSGQRPADGVREGLVDEGWHDTVLVMPGERVKIRMRFARYAGLFLYHCHNLEHEDMGMMRNYWVEA